MSQRFDVMIDIETLGVDIHSTVFQICACGFDLTTGKIINQFNCVADISKADVQCTGKTLKWWLNTNKELFTNLINQGNVSELEMFSEFHKWLSYYDDEGYDIYLWGKGILFDNNIIKSKFLNMGLSYPIFYRNDRDVRTIIELACLKNNTTEKEISEKVISNDRVEHDAFSDVKHQIALVHECYKIIVKE